jgi:hypothetical protein
MNWVFIVARNNSIEQVKMFKDYWSGASYTDSFIRNINPNMVDTPFYNRNESYVENDLSVGLYKCAVE